MGKSMLDREEYVVGGLTKALAPVVKRVAKLFGPDEEQKAIRAKIDKVHSEVEAAPSGSKKQTTIKEVANNNDLTISQVKDIEKLIAFERGGGRADNTVEKVIQMYRAKTTKPTAGQKVAEDLGGGGDTREAAIKAANTGMAGLGIGSLLGAGATIGAMKAWDSQNDSAPTEKQATAFEKAFSKAHNAGKKTFKFEGKEYTTEVRKGKALGGEMDSFGMLYEAFKEEMDAAEDQEEKAEIQARFQEQTRNIDEETKREFYKSMDQEPKKIRLRKEEGGSMLVPPEMPVDTFTPEEQANAESSQLPDNEMEDDYMGFMLDESLDETEQEYLMGALEADPRLSEIFDKVVTTASEFSGAGEVEGPGTGVSDSIPARLSDGEFVMTEAATSEIGADNLQTMMDDAERRSSGGKVGFAVGGLLNNPYGMDKQQMEEEDEDLVAQTMMSANQMPSLMGGRR
jgi:thiamine pyrophosphokinase